MAATALTLTPLLSADQVAEVLGVSRAQVYLVKHQIGFVRFGRTVRFDPARVREYVDAHRQGVPEQIGKISVRAL